MTTTFVTLATEPMWEVWRVAEKTWGPYCKRHGHELVVFHELFDQTIHPSWNKLYAILHALSMSERDVWWIDADTMVANQHIDLEVYDPGEKDLLFSSDWNGLCCGLFRARNTPWVRRFLGLLPALGDVQDPDEFGAGLGVKWEQNAIKLLTANFPDVRRRIRTMPDVVNDRPERPRTEDVVWHFSCMDNARRLQMMRERLEEIRGTI